MEGPAGDTKSTRPLSETNGNRVSGQPSNPIRDGTETTAEATGNPIPVQTVHGNERIAGDITLSPPSPSVDPAPTSNGKESTTGVRADSASSSSIEAVTSPSSSSAEGSPSTNGKPTAADSASSSSIEATASAPSSSNDGSPTPDANGSSAEGSDPSSSSSSTDAVRTENGNGPSAEVNGHSGTESSPTSSSSAVDPEFVAQVGTLDIEPEVLRRVNALRVLQTKVLEVDGDKFREIHALEQKYAELYRPYWEKRRKIIAGHYEPTDEECEFPLEEDEYCFMKYYKQLIETKAAEAKAKNEPFGTGPLQRGIPGFWTQICSNVRLLRRRVQDYDRPILKYLTDVHYEMITDPVSYTLVFHFKTNPFFKNPTLTKTYELRSATAGRVPLWFNGLEIYKATGCEIDWYEGMDVTEELVEVDETLDNGCVMTVKKMVKLESFFHFFQSSQVAETVNCPEDLDFTVDAELAKYIKERIVGKAILYYTGEATLGVTETFSELDEDSDAPLFDDEDSDLGEEEEDLYS